MNWDAVILAAGRGRRMGGPKALLDMGGVTLLELQLRALGGASRIAVVISEAGRHLRPRGLGFGSDALEDGAPPADSPQPIVVPNLRPDEGPWLSIRLGLEALGGAVPALIVPVDCPVPLEAPTRLLAGAAEDLAWVAPVHEGRRGHPVLLTGTGRAAALEPGAGPTLRDLLDAYPGAEVPLASSLVHCNLNTPSDRDRFLADHPSWPDPLPGDSP